ncbi:MAG: hypothetical protein N3F66_14555 [Spirochaetes bacterium]|nr:hypothetical protein [Spirochaetota bacterium]
MKMIKGTTIIKKLVIFTLILFLLFSSIFLIVYSNPVVRFMMVMNEIIPAWGVSSVEVTLPLKEGKHTKMTIYQRILGYHDRYYFCIHGMTPQGYTHPSLVKLAKALALATGRKVLVPYLYGSETDRDVIDATKEIQTMYMEVRKRYPGKYNGFGACISATMLVAALKDIPLELYPDKIFMYGPFLNGQMLMHFYNTSGMEVDFIVKLANAMRHPHITDEEKKLVSKAIAATKPGITDRQEMKRVLGDALFKKIDSLKVENPEFKQINEMTLFEKGKPLPKCKFYILHSRTDNIIPFSMGMSMHKYLLQRGLQSTFVATGAFHHTQKDRSFSKLKTEFNEIYNFFKDLFEE